MKGERFHFSSRDVADLAILIIRTGDGTHTGIIHRRRGALYRLGLAWHERLESSPANGVESCVIPELLEEEINDITGLCRLIERKWVEEQQPRIPYAFRYDAGAHFEDSGDLVLGDGLGLTCSTFVMKIFEKARVPLLAWSNWPLRSDDEVRHRALLTLMRRTHVPTSHIIKVQSELSCVRFRPEEVAAAAMTDLFPASFEQVEPAGRWIIEMLTPHEGHVRI